jgi:hypothetical protein
MYPFIRPLVQEVVSKVILLNFLEKLWNPLNTELNDTSKLGYNNIFESVIRQKRARERHAHSLLLLHHPPSLVVWILDGKEAVQHTHQSLPLVP